MLPAHLVAADRPWVGFTAVPYVSAPGDEASELEPEQSYPLSEPDTPLRDPLRRHHDERGGARRHPERRVHPDRNEAHTSLTD